MKLDIHSAVQTVFLLALVGMILSVWIGVRTIQSGRKLPFFRKRRDRMMRGWRMVFSAFCLVLVAFFLNRYAEPAIYHFYPPSPTVTATPTITETPTITPTPTITLTPTITPTLSVTPTPFVPVEIESSFTSQVTPSPDATFSPLLFAQSIDRNTWQPIDPAVEFKTPVGHLYATFSYDQMQDGSQWTALWYRGSELVYFETKPWDGGTGGYGYTDWNPPADQWIPGEYDVFIFNGLILKTSGHFTVTGTAPTAAPTTRASRTPTTHPSAVGTPTPSLTPTLTPTHRPTNTATITPTRPPTSTQRPSLTPRPTDTHWPTATELPTQKP